MDLFNLHFQVIVSLKPTTCLFTVPHETEAGTTCDHITLNFECRDGSSLPIVLQKEVLDCIYDNILLNFKRQEEALSCFLYKREAGITCEKVYCIWSSDFADNDNDKDYFADNDK